METTPDSLARPDTYDPTATPTTQIPSINTLPETMSFVFIPFDDVVLIVSPGGWCSITHAAPLAHVYAVYATCHVPYTGLRLRVQSLVCSPVHPYPCSSHAVL